MQRIDESLKQKLLTDTASVTPSEIKEESVFSDLLLESGIASSEDDSIKLRKQNLAAINLQSLQPGDILLYLPKNNHLTLSHKIIACTQVCLRIHSGDSQIVHSGIFQGFGENHAPMIAHLVGAGFKISKLKEDQPLLIFRAQSEAFANSIVKEANLVNASENKPKWTLKAGIQVILDRSRIKAQADSLPHYKAISTNSVCSKLVAEVVGNAVSTDPNYKEYLLKKGCNATPKDLEAELFQNHNYQMLFYLGNNLQQTPYDIIEKTVQLEIEKLNGNKKWYVEEEFKGCKKRLEKQPEKDNLEKALYLANCMKNTFNEVGSTCRTESAGSQKLSQVTSKIGLFKTVLNRYRQDAEPDNDAANLDLYSMDKNFRVGIP